MHLPLIDIPKQRRSARPRCASASMLFGVCLLASWVWIHPPLPPIRIIVSPAAEASPIQYVTVTTSQKIGEAERELHVEATYQKPVMELYDELSEIEDTTERTDRADAENEQDYLHREKEFAEKYGLTLSQVDMIKRDGYRTQRTLGE